jgi:hypothetical protein
MLERCCFFLIALTLAQPAQAIDRNDAELALVQATTALQNAERADADVNAPAEMQAARAMFASAQGAFERRAWLDSAMSAEKAKLDGDLAAARARQQRAREATAQIEASVRDLRVQLGLPAGDVR